ATFCSILTSSFFLSFYYHITYLQFICVLVMLNLELIVSKMARCRFRMEVVYFCLICVTSNKYISLVLTAYVVLYTFLQLKRYLRIPFLSVFRTE
ncbi:MAG: hypothetical protein QW303_06285, partial [Nitrososphaerota archaeon]